MSSNSLLNSNPIFIKLIAYLLSNTPHNGAPSLTKSPDDHLQTPSISMSFAPVQKPLSAVFSI